MEYLIGIVVLFILFKVFSGKGSSKSSKNGGCKHCGGELVPTSAKGYSFRCRDCAERFV